MKKQTIELPIEWIEGLKNYIDNVKKTATFKDEYSPNRFAVAALLGYLESLQSEILKNKMIEELKEEARKRVVDFTQIGKVFKTKNYCNKCECGNVNTMESYRNFKEGTNKPVKQVYLSFCDCGNVFKADLCYNK